MATRWQWLMWLAVVAAACGQARTDWFPWLGLRLDPGVNVVSVWPGSSAQTAGIQAGDHIVSIGGQPTAAMGHGSVLQKLRGNLGSKVDLVLERQSNRYHVTLTHAPLPPATPLYQPTLEADDLDRILIVVSGRDQDTDHFFNLALQATARLPRSLKHRFVTAGIRLVLTPSLKELNGEDGSCRYEPRSHQAIMCEHSSAAPTAQLDPRVPIVTLHELGHACDHMLHYYSQTPEFLACYHDEAPQVPAADRPILEHFLQPGRAGPSECFASLFACKYYHEPDPRLDALKVDFPRCFALVRALQD